MLPGPTNPSQVRLRIRGRVQGTWYRASTQREAELLGVAGWVRNEPDGSVSVLAQGPRELLGELVRWTRRGPTGARVDKVEVKWGEPGALPPGFRIIR